MKNFTDSYAVAKLSKEVMQFIKIMEQPHRDSKSKNVSIHLERLYNQGVLTKQDYLFLSARVILNDLCYRVEKHVGRGSMAGFTFYCEEENKLSFGAGANYPKLLKDFLIRRTPTLNMKGSAHYKNEVFIVKDVDQWEPSQDWENYKETFQQTNVKSLMSKRLRLHDVTFGTFELYFPTLGGPTEDELAYIRKEVQPLKEELYHIRAEMLEAVYHAVDNLGSVSGTGTF